MLYICNVNNKNTYCKLKMENNVREFLVLEGYTNDLLMVNPSGSMKMTRLIKLDPNIKELDEEIVDIADQQMNMERIRYLMSCLERKSD